MCRLCQYFSILPQTMVQYSYVAFFVFFTAMKWRPSVTAPLMDLPLPLPCPLLSLHTMMPCGGVALQASLLGGQVGDAHFFGWRAGSEEVEAGGRATGDKLLTRHHDWGGMVQNVQNYIKGLNFKYRADLRSKGVSCLLTGHQPAATVANAAAVVLCCSCRFPFLKARLCPLLVSQIVIRRRCFRKGWLWTMTARFDLIVVCIRAAV